MIFYEKSFRKRFTWSNAKILVVARNSICLSQNKFSLKVFKNTFEKTILYNPWQKAEHLRRNRQKWNMAYRLLSCDLETCPYSEVKRIELYLQYLKFVNCNGKYVLQKYNMQFFEEKVPISRFLIFSFQWVLSKFAGLESVPSLNPGNAKF